MIVHDEEINMLKFDEVDKFIEIEISKANERGQVCFVQVARE